MSIAQGRASRLSSCRLVQSAYMQSQS